MSKQDIKKAVVNAFKQQLEGVKVSWPNVKFTPPEGLWCRFFYNEASDTPVTCGAGGENELRGFVQVDINVKTNSGEKEQTDLMSSLEAHFTSGRVMALEGASATVTGNVRGPSRVEGSSWTIPLTIYFKARYQRAVA